MTTTRALNMTFESQARNVNFYFALIFVFFLFFLLWAPSTVFCLQIDLDKHSHSAKRPYSSFFHVATKVIFTFFSFPLKSGLFSFSLHLYEQMSIHFHTASNVSRFSRFVIFHFISWQSMWIWKANDGVI